MDVEELYKQIKRYKLFSYVQMQHIGDKRNKTGS